MFNSSGLMEIILPQVTFIFIRIHYLKQGFFKQGSNSVSQKVGGPDYSLKSTMNKTPISSFEEKYPYESKYNN